MVPGVAPKSFSEIFREDPMDMNSLLEALKDNFPKIIEVFHAEIFHHLAYNYTASPTGFWAIPPAFGYDGLHRRDNTIVLYKTAFCSHQMPYRRARAHADPPPSVTRAS